MGVITHRKPNFVNERGQARRHSPDYWLLILMLALTAVGIIVVYSISPALEVEKGVNGGTYVLKQMIAVAVGLVLFGITAAVPMDG